MTRTRRLCFTLLAAVVIGLLAPATASQADPSTTPTPAQDRRSDRQAKVTLEEALAKQYAGTRARWSMYLCSGYNPCRDAGYSNAKYKRNSDRMFWLMYSGHNCTNYAAYRMVRAGMPNRRPWSGTGNAYNWGLAKPGITNDKPMVGAVAWWRRNVPGAGSNGHVAYVEKVISKRKIIISEDSWSGDFHWRRIRKQDGSWPSGFIHFRDKRVRATTAPAIVGAPQVGVPLRLDPGAWSTKSTLTRQWYADGKPIEGATGATFTPTPEQARQRLTARVVAKALGYRTGKATTEPTVRVRRGDLELTRPAAITGTTRVGEVLSLEQPAWSPTPATTTIQWFAGDQPVAGATGSRFRLTPAQVHQPISVQVTARADGYHRAVAASDPTEAVRRGRFAVTSPFGLEGRALVGRRLTATTGTYTPAGATLAYHWFRDGKEIEGAADATYELVPRDLGRTVTVQVTLRSEGYRSKTVSPEGIGPVRTKSVTALTITRKGHKAIVRVEVTAPGRTTVRGPVTLTFDDLERTKKLDRSRARWVVKHLKHGLHDVKVAYAGTELVTASSASGQLRVPRG